MKSLNPEIVAAVDLGSNSFHMIVARIENGQLKVIDRLKEMVRLAGGLDDRDQLDPGTAERAIGCLERFGQRVRNMPPGSVGAVGTNTLRRARNAKPFLIQAETALGHPIEIIAGREEARLIYLGVAHSIAHDHAQRLVMDIGGGSTEVIIGRDFEPIQRESLFMGCVSMSRRFFDDGKIRSGRMRDAELAARQELEWVEAPYRRVGWDASVGASGTIRAIRDVVVGQGWSDAGITAGSLKKLRKAMLDAGHVDKLSLDGLQTERAPVFPGGVAILTAAFDALGIKQMAVADGALREGLLYDLLGRISHKDVREATIDSLSQRYQVDAEQAARVEATALYLLDRVADDWRLLTQESTNLLSWAARLHEIGLSIAHTGYHKHGAYLLEHADLPGFSRREQALLALLVRAHRRKFPAGIIAAITGKRREHALRLSVLLRVAVVLHRGHSEIPPPKISIESDTEVRLVFPEGWLNDHRLTEADLRQEAAYLESAGIKLSFE